MKGSTQHIEGVEQEAESVSYCLRYRPAGRLIRVYSSEGVPGSGFHPRYELLDNESQLPVYTRNTAAELLKFVQLDPTERVGTYKRPRVKDLTISSLDDVEILEQCVMRTYIPVNLEVLATTIATTEEEQ